MFVLGIETTCDETAAAIIERDEAGHGRILANIVYSQTKEHRQYGGVVPEIAARAHVEILDFLIKKAMIQADIDYDDLDGIAAASGPGLIGGLIVGLTTAKTLAMVTQKPFIGVNHLEAHVLTARLVEPLEFPYLVFLASGGHTQIIAVTGVGNYKILGTTLDDAIGEAFDKVAKMLSLGYPGGPEVEKWAIGGDPTRFSLPRPLNGRPEPDFSLSGLKTAVRIEAEALAPLSEKHVADLCASFQAAIIDVVVDRIRVGIRRFLPRYGQATGLVVAGGVGANKAIRSALERVVQDYKMPLIAPPANLCTDNAAMIAWAGAERLAFNISDPLDLAPRARWSLEDVETPAGSMSGRLSPISE